VQPLHPGPSVPAAFPHPFGPLVRHVGAIVQQGERRIVASRVVEVEFAGGLGLLRQP
jgi:hypothetical protein